MPTTRTLRKDNFHVNILPINIEAADGNSQVGGIDKLIHASALEAASHSLIVGATDDDDLPVYIVGDLHGNAVKLLAVLSLCGAITLNSKSFKEWSDIYESLEPGEEFIWRNRRMTTPDQIRMADEYMAQNITRPTDLERRLIFILDGLGWNKSFKGQVVLLGDQLHDRGRSDFMTLMLMDKMHQMKINYSYIIGNHDQGVIYRFLVNKMEGEAEVVGVKDNLMASATSDRHSYDYTFLNARQKDIFKKCLKNALLHARLYEYFSVGQETVLCSHCIPQPRLMPQIYQLLCQITGKKAVKDESHTTMTLPLIKDINTLFQAALVGKAAVKAALVVAIDSRSDNALVKQLHDRSSSVGTAVIELIKSEYPGYFLIYGHDLEGEIKNLGKIKAGTTAFAEHQLCLDTMLGRPKLSNAERALGAIIDPENPIHRFKKRDPKAEEYDLHLQDHGANVGDLLVCSIKPDMKNPELKAEMTRDAIRNGCNAYLRYFYTLSTDQQKTKKDETDAAIQVIKALGYTSTAAGARKVLRRYALGELHETCVLANQALAGQDGHNDLLSYLLDSINASYPPLSLATKLGCAEVGGQSFLIDYTNEKQGELNDTEMKRIKTAAFERMKTLAEKLGEQDEVKPQNIPQAQDIAQAPTNQTGAVQERAPLRRINAVRRPKNTGRDT
ncbi:MAG: hypothetical protein ACR2HF_03685 [Methylococcaceae bacterium]